MTPSVSAGAEGAVKERPVELRRFPAQPGLRCRAIPPRNPAPRCIQKRGGGEWREPQIPLPTATNQLLPRVGRSGERRKFES